MPFQTRWNVEGELIVTVASGEITVDDITHTTQTVVSMMDNNPQNTIGWVIYCPTQPIIPYDVKPIMTNARFALATNNLDYCIICGEMSGILLVSVKLLTRLLPKLSYCATDEELQALLKERAPSVVLKLDHIVAKSSPDES